MNIKNINFNTPNPYNYGDQPIQGSNNEPLKDTPTPQEIQQQITQYMQQLLALANAMKNGYNASLGQDMSLVFDKLNTLLKNTLAISPPVPGRDQLLGFQNMFQDMEWCLNNDPGEQHFNYQNFMQNGSFVKQAYFNYVKYADNDASMPTDPTGNMSSAEQELSNFLQGKNADGSAIMVDGQPLLNLLGPYLTGGRNILQALQAYDSATGNDKMTQDMAAALMTAFTPVSGIIGALQSDVAGLMYAGLLSQTDLTTIENLSQVASTLSTNLKNLTIVDPSDPWVGKAIFLRDLGVVAAAFNNTDYVDAIGSILNETNNNIGPWQYFKSPDPSV